jgi:hypothetical protein
MAESVVETNEAVSGAATASEFAVAQTYAPMSYKQHRGGLSNKRLHLSAAATQKGLLEAGRNRLITGPLALGLRGSFGPQPQTVRHIGREAMAELARHQHNLAAVMAFMSDEVGQHMPHVER